MIICTSYGLFSLPVNQEFAIYPANIHQVEYTGGDGTQGCYDVGDIVFETPFKKFIASNMAEPREFFWNRLENLSFGENPTLYIDAFDDLYPFEALHIDDK